MKFNPGTLVTVKNERFVWKITGFKMNLFDRQPRVKITRDAGWAIITRTIKQSLVKPYA